MRFALVGENKSEPFPKGRGICPTCEGPVISKCGPIKVWHWAHESNPDCDTWSEPVGPWHLSWQRLVQPEFVEVPIAPHRADIVGHNGTVIELQHSTINCEEIEEREKFYDKMVWLFDATYRFGGVRTGDRYFFSFGRTRHIEACRKPVFLDFGSHLVQIASITELFHSFSGVGVVRDREWFVQQFLADRLSGVTLPDLEQLPPIDRTSMFDGRPWGFASDSSHWVINGREQVLPAGTPYIPIDYDKRNPYSLRPPVWSEVIAKYSDMALGWTGEAFDEMKQFLRGTPVILEGRLRLMPASPDRTRAFTIVEEQQELLQKAEPHINAGRLPRLSAEYRSLLVQRGREFEMTLRPSEAVRLRSHFRKTRQRSD